MGMKFGTWNVMSLNRPGSLKIISSEPEKYKVALEVGWDKGGSQPVNRVYIFLWKWEC
jgi:hypothetical protein